MSLWNANDTDFGPGVNSEGQYTGDNADPETDSGDSSSSSSGDDKSFLDYLNEAVDTGTKVYKATQKPKAGKAPKAASAGRGKKADHLTIYLLIGGGALLLV